MAEVRPLRGIRFDPARVDLGRTIAPPYDVIDETSRLRLLDADPHNIVRVDLAAEDDQGSDRYELSARHLRQWCDEGILRCDSDASLYVLEHDFPLEDGTLRTRRGLFGRILARPWSHSPIRPHERTLPGPKQDRLLLMRACHAQTSPVFGLWQGAPDLPVLLTAATAGEPVAACDFHGEMGGESLRLWAVTGDGSLGRLSAALLDATLYIADGHHRYETAARYAGERRAADPDAPADASFEHCLVHLCAADDSSLVVLPTHRLVPFRPGVPETVSEVESSVSGRFAVDAVADLTTARAMAATRRESDHAIVAIVSDGALLLTRPRRAAADPRSELDVAVLEELLAVWGIATEEIAAGVLGYERNPAAVTEGVASGRWALGALLNGCSTRELIAVADAGGTMPQKSTYFYPKVPTGLVIAPL